MHTHVVIHAIIEEVTIAKQCNYIHFTVFPVVSVPLKRHFSTKYILVNDPIGYMSFYFNNGASCVTNHDYPCSYLTDQIAT